MLYLPVLLGEGLLQVGLETTEPYLVALLELAVLFPLTLDGVIGEMDHVVQVFDAEEVGAGSDIAVSIPVELAVSSQANAQEECPDVKLPPLVEQQVGLVFLNDGRAAESLSVFHCLPDFFQRITYEDVSAPVRIFTRFNDPQIQLVFLLLKSA